MSSKTRLSLQTQKDVLFPDNNNQEISAGDLRAHILDLQDSVYIKLTDAIRLAYSESIFYAVGDNCVYSGALYACTAATNGVFDITKWTRLGNNITNFTQLGDVPSSYTGQGLKAVRVNAAATALEFYTPPGVPQLFIDLADVPNSYTGQAGKLVRVNGSGTGLEFNDSNSVDPNKWFWAQHFNDVVGFNLVNALRPDAATGAIAGNPVGVAWNRIETNTPYASVIRRDTTNGGNYPMHSGSSKFVFNMRCNFEVLPTSGANYRAGWSFSNTTGPFSDSRFSVFLTNNGGNLIWRIAVAQSSILFTEVDVAATVAANTWYKFTVEIDRANAEYRFLINNSLIYAFTPANNVHQIPLDFYGFIMYSETTTTRATATRVLIDYYEEYITLNTPIVW